jgi:hypothetical protein
LIVRKCGSAQGAYEFDKAKLKDERTPVGACLRLGPRFVERTVSHLVVQLPLYFGDALWALINTGVSGGQTGIRTLDRLSPIHAFQACAFNHSATCPERRVMAGAAFRRKARN